ncbi:MAG: hypothetical protein ACJ8KX_10375 [Chthoniobacterales bacterium]
MASFLDETTPATRVDGKAQIAAALAKMGRLRVPTRSTNRRTIGRVTAAFALFAIAAFGGGLFLAHVSFNTPDRPIVVTSQPELLYLSPQTSASLPVGFAAPQVQQSDATAAPRLFAGGAIASPILSPEANTEASSTLGEVEADQEGTATAEPSARKLDIRAIAQTFADSASFALAARAQDAQNANPLLAAYQAVQMSAIPEPSSGVVVALLVAAIIASAARRRRRAITPL